jgi:SAM-dependent methyltransferase
VKLDTNGLKSFKDKSFNILACYSVLHHIPDSLQAIKEMTRIVKSGGIIYIDHEVNESYWNPNEDYIQFLAHIRPYNKKSKKWYRWFQFSHYTNEFILRIRKTGIFRNTTFTNPLNPRYQPYGDIHVWSDDHIEWSKIEQLLRSTKNTILIKDDYLLYKAHYPKHIYDQFKNKCSDHRVLIAKKL